MRGGRWLICPELLQVLWKEIQSLQMEAELDYNSYDNLKRQGGGGGWGGEGGRGYGADQQRATLSKNMRVTERKLSRLLAGASMYEDSDSSRGNLFLSSQCKLLARVENFQENANYDPLESAYKHILKYIEILLFQSWKNWHSSI